MSIRAKLLLVALLPAGMLLLVGWVTLSALGRIEAARGQHQAASGVVKGAFQLTLLTYEYLQQHSDRSRDQWLAKHASMSRYLAEAQAVRDTDRDALRELCATHKEIGRLFRRLVRAHDAGAGDEFSAQTEQRLTDQLLTRSHEMLATASRLSAGADLYMDGVFHWTGAIVLTAALSCAAAVAIIALLVRRSVVRPLGRLHSGLREVGAGNLDCRLELPPKDEIGQVACAFDRMTEQLRSVTVSRDAMAREVARRTEAEEQLQAALRDLRDRNRELEQFAYAAAHDLQEPLRKIQAFGDRLMTECPAEGPGRAREYADRMRNAAGRMSRLVNDLLTFTRVGAQGRAFAEVDLTREAESAAASLAPAIRAANARVAISPLPRAQAEADEMWLLFRCLIDNAVKFRKPGASPEVRVTGEVHADNGHPRCVLRVADDGIGFDEKYLGRLFAIFRRLHSAEEYEGTGLGLALCRKIAEGHGGSITAHSQPGRGTTIEVTLPLAQDRKGATPWEKPS